MSGTAVTTPVLAVSGWAPRFQKAIPDVLPNTKEQRCWWHKIGNVLARSRSRCTRREEAH
jgi:transposase-like protein